MQVFDVGMDPSAWHEFKCPLRVSVSKCQVSNRGIKRIDEGSKHAYMFVVTLLVVLISN